MLTLLNSEEIKNIYNKYMVKDFPPDELKPLSSMMDMLSRGIYDCYGLYEEEKLLAYAYLTVLDDFILVDYLAVVPELRGSGIGSKLLCELKNIIRDKTIIIECENPDFATDPQDKTTKIRRIDFYKRSGFVLSGVLSRLFDVEYVILTYPECNNSALGYEKLYLQMLGQEVCSKKLIVKS
ncbi:MAG: GNAT family N-acetyltransferase [Clostridia bacterium]|nr:GNAT family N-acetyltransferase [Clostridia bacterium]